MNYSWEWCDRNCVHTFIYGGAYITVAAACVSWSEVMEALRGHLGIDEFTHTPIIISSMAMLKPDFETFVEECHPNVVL
jgi:hypothetical protein